MKKTISVLLACYLVFSVLSISITTSADEDNNVSRAIGNFSSELFKHTYQQGNIGKNMIVSPLSLYTDTAMLDNGAANQTQSEILSMLQGGDENITQDDLNNYFKNYMQSISNDKIVNMANCVYFSDRDDIKINNGFVKTAKNFYYAEVFQAPPDNSTINRINNWASDNTNGAIKDIVGNDDINEETNSVLLNAVAFYGEWEDKYTDSQIRSFPFNNYDGSTYEADFLCDTLDTYYSDDKAVAFTRPYKGDYEFIAILPNEDVGIDKYIETMDGSTINNLLNNSNWADVYTRIPKFEFNNDLILNDTLRKMGMVEAFDFSKADFSQLAPSTDKNTYISNVKQKTHIRLDENGTKAEAVTVYDDIVYGAAQPWEEIEIYLDRPFIFMIYDTLNSQPLFIGTVCELSADLQPKGDFTSSIVKSSNFRGVVVALIAAIILICVVFVTIILIKKRSKKKQSENI